MTLRIVVIQQTRAKTNRINDKREKKTAGFVTSKLINESLFCSAFKFLIFNFKFFNNFVTVSVLAKFFAS